MNKRYSQFLFTSIGIALSFLIAIGGWRLTIKLLGIKENSLLSVTGSVHVDTQAVESTDEETAQHYPVMTESEMSKVLLNWESGRTEQPHEPIEGQLNMEQAINAGKAGLTYFFEQGIIPAELLEYDKTNAYLCEKKSGVEDQALSPYYSYWTIKFSVEDRNAKLTINAMTGQIWKAEFSGIDTDEIEVEKVLDAFVSYLDLDGSGSYTTDGTTASKSFSDVILHAVANGTTASKSFSDGILHAVAISRIPTAEIIDDTIVEIPKQLLIYLTTEAASIGLTTSIGQTTETPDVG